MDGLFGDGLVDVLCCGGDSLEEDLRWGPRLGASVDLVEFEDGVTNGGVALFKIVEALSGGAFFFSTSVELKTKGAGGGGAGREMMDSNTSLPAILTPKHFLAVSAICFDRSDFACICFSGKFLVHNCGWAICKTTFVTRDTICSAVKLSVLLGGGGEACFTMEA